MPIPVLHDKGQWEVSGRNKRRRFVNRVSIPPITLPAEMAKRVMELREEGERVSLLAERAFGLLFEEMDRS